MRKYVAKGLQTFSLLNIFFAEVEGCVENSVVVWFLLAGCLFLAGESSWHQNVALRCDISGENKLSRTLNRFKRSRHYLTAGFFALRKSKASFDAWTTKAAWFGLFLLPDREFEVDGVGTDETSIPVEVNGFSPRLRPSSSLITAIEIIFRKWLESQMRLQLSVATLSSLSLMMIPSLYGK